MGPFYNYLNDDGTYTAYNSWWVDTAHFIEGSWMFRGGHYNNGIFAGQLSFGSSTGGVNNLIGFRIVLAN